MVLKYNNNYNNNKNNTKNTRIIIIVIKTIPIIEIISDPVQDVWIPEFSTIL